LFWSDQTAAILGELYRFIIGEVKHGPLTPSTQTPKSRRVECDEQYTTPILLRIDSVYTGVIYLSHKDGEGPRKEGKKMAKTFKTKGYELTRKSENKVFTHAVIFRNISNGDLNAAPNATFHVSLKLAETEMNRMIKRTDWLIPLEIVEIEEIVKGVL
jgi:hypothetical protein